MARPEFAGAEYHENRHIIHFGSPAGQQFWSPPEPDPEPDNLNASETRSISWWWPFQKS